MPKFSIRSTTNLSTCKRDTQTIFMEVVKWIDCTIVEGHRTAEIQHEHWQKGRKLKYPGIDTKKNDSWIIVNKDKVVTYKDGYEKLSDHQKLPSVAVDVVPYPEMWNSEDSFLQFIGAVKVIQARLLAEGKITALLDNGFDLWNWDFPHWQEKK